MKKKILILVAVIIALTAAFVGCAEEADQYDLVKKNVSYMQTGMLTGKTDNYRVTLAMGMREESFIADGQVTNVQPYATLTMKPLNTDLYDKTFAYKVVGESGEVSGEMNKSLLGVAFTAEVPKCGEIGVIKSVIITCADSNEEVAMTNALKDMISADKALEYAYNAMIERIGEDIKDGAFAREVYVKFINDRKNPDSPYYWYVSFMKDSKDHYSVLIEPKTGEIMNKKH